MTEIEKSLRARVREGEVIEKERKKERMEAEREKT